jgi:hypothetical protein
MAHIIFNILYLKGSAQIMIFIKAKLKQAYLFPLFLLTVILITCAYGHESGAASFSLETNTRAGAGSPGARLLQSTADAG